MGSSSRNDRVVQFGPFQADLHSGELWKAGIKLKLHTQPFQILAMLLEQPGKLISRDEIRQRLWPEDTFVDFDHGLNNVVNRLREALGDSASTPRFIETVPRRGYRFIGTINESPTKPESSGSAEKTETPERRRSIWLIGSALAASLILMFAILFLLKNPVQPSSRSFVLPPEGTTFNLMRDSSGPVALSADGSKLAFVATDAKGTSRIWIRSLGKLTAQVLEHTEGATFPFWSPDGRWIAFFSDSERKLKKIPVEGGPAVPLCDAPFGRGGSWSPQGVIVFTPYYFAALYRVSESGGTPTQVTNVDPSIHTSHRWPQFLPDGHHFIYLAINHRHDSSHDGIYLGSINGNENMRIVASHANAAFASGYLFYLSDDVLMAQPFDPKRTKFQGEARATIDKVVYDPTIWKGVFDVSEHGVMAYQLGGNVRGPEMQWFDRFGKTLGAAGETGSHSAPRLSPDGRKLLAGRATRFGNYSDLWVYDLERNLSTRITFEDEDTSNGVWSHDGGRIIFNAKGQQLHSSIYDTDAGGDGRKQLIFETGTDIQPSDLSPDGQFLLYLQAGDPGAGEARLWVAPMKGVGKSFPLVGHGSQGFGKFSPLGRWVAYTSQDSGRDEIYVIPFQPQTAFMTARNTDMHTRWQISSSGGKCPRWRGDGKEMFFLSADNTLMSVSINNQASKFDASAPRPLFRAGLSNTVGATVSLIYDVSRDGKRFIFTSGVPPESKAPITLVQNWLSDLKR